MSELVPIKFPRSKAQREADAWAKGMDGKTVREQWVLELIRHGRSDRIEEFIGQVEAGKEELPESKRGFVLWRSRGILDHDLANHYAADMQRVFDGLDEGPVYDISPGFAMTVEEYPTPPWHDEALVNTSRFPRLEALGLQA